MDDAANLTLEVLKQIRDEARKTNERIDQTNQRLDQTNQRLDQTNQRLDRLERRQNEAETRLATELLAVVGAIHELRDTIKDQLEVKKRVDDHERRLTLLEQQKRH